MAVPPVVNRARLERLAPPPSGVGVVMNANTVCILIIILCTLCLFKRASDISHKRQQLDTLTL